MTTRTTETAVPLTPVGMLRVDRDFRRFWFSRLVSVGGSSVTYVVLPVLVYQLTRSPLLTALVSACEALPYLLFGLVAGALADRWDRRRVMVTSDVLSVLVVGSVPLAAQLGVLTVPHVLACAFLVPTLFVFFDAAEFGAVPSLVGRAGISAANSAIWSAGTAVETVGPAVAGAALAVVAPAQLLAVDALSFAASALFVRAVVGPMSDPARPAGRLDAGRLREDVRVGLRFLWGQPVVRVTALVGLAQAVSGGAFVGQLVVWADRSLGVRGGDPRLGVLFGAWGVGALAATVSTSRLERRWGPAGLVLRAVSCSALLSVVTALAPSWPVAAVLVVAWGMAYMLVVVPTITYRQQVTPPALMSRVSTTGRVLSFGVGYPLGALLGGLVSSAAGPRAGMLAGSAAVVTGAVLAWWSPLRPAAARH